MAHIIHLSKLYQFSTTPNAEIRLCFYELALRDHTSHTAKAFAGEAANWVVGDDGTGVIKGRMKFCRPVFRAVYKVDKNLAVSTFQSKRYAFHPIARKLIEKVRPFSFYSCVY
jgi:leukotriene-A4 hydrolase